jgi:hypothetical protein
VAGYDVTQQALALAAKGINDTIAELKTLGMDEEAEIGRGFSSLALRGMQVGHQGLEQAFGQFCERWSWGVRTLVQDASQIAASLGLSAGAYYDAEQYAQGTLKDVVSDTAGNPHLADAQVEKQSWSQLVNAQVPDYSGESFKQAGQDMEQTWKAEGRDVLEGPMGRNKELADALGAGQAFDQAEDEVFGSAPQQGGGG